jgi:hypothetical protein
MVRIYITIWAIIAVFAAVILVAGNMSMMVALAIGFIVFGMIFAGMMMVLPATVAHGNHPDTPKVKIANQTNHYPTGAVHAR